MVSAHFKIMKVIWEDYSQYIQKKKVPNHQPAIYHLETPRNSTSPPKTMGLCVKTIVQVFQAHRICLRQQRRLLGWQLAIRMLMTYHLVVTYHRKTIGTP